MKNRMMFFRKTWTLVLALLLLGALSACGAPAEGPGVPPEEEPESQEEEFYTTYSTQGVSFRLPADWTQAEGTDLFYATGRREVYGLNGVSPPGLL